MKRKTRESLTGIGFVTPSLALLLVFMLSRIVMVFYYSLTKYNGKASPEFIGFENYINLFKDPAMGYALRNSLIFTVVTVPILCVISLCLAAIIAQGFRNRFGSFVRSSLFIPVICSSTLVATVWYFMFSSDPHGAVNAILNIFGIEAVDWLGKEVTALLVICFVNIWKQIGYYLVIYYAAIMDIPRELFDASEVDGASKLQQFRFITLPSLKSITYLVLTLCTIDSFQVFDIAYTMTAGGPGFATTSLVYRVYVESFKNWKLGYGCAIACVMLVIIFALSLAQRLLFREKVDE